ncbi:hypothetical protein D3C73_1135550 [compost metagenome]
MNTNDKNIAIYITITFCACTPIDKFYIWHIFGNTNNNKYLQKLQIMAIAIKVIPVLKDKVAASFERQVSSNFSNRASVDFSSQVKSASKILSKAKI